MKWDITFIEKLKKFSGAGGWVYVPVPKKFTEKLKQRRKAWGMYPITAHVGKTSWKTKLMMKKGGDFFVAFKEAVRDEEKLKIGDKITISFKIGRI